MLVLIKDGRVPSHVCVIYRSSSKMASKRDALDKGGESISKKRSLKQQIRDTQRLLAKVELAN